MKFSLRTLMIVVTVACLVLGTMARRMDYLSRKASFHERQYAMSMDRLTEITKWKADDIQYVMENIAQSDLTDPDGRAEDLKMLFFEPYPHPPPRYPKEYAKRRDEFAPQWSAAYNHRRLAEAYRHAIRHPFELVDESSPPPPHR